MENRNEHLPILDSLIQSRELQIMKTVVPFLEPESQRTFSMMIRLTELQKTLQLFDQRGAVQAAELRICEHQPTYSRMSMMLHAVREYCTESEQESIDNMISFCEFLSLQTSEPY